MNADTWNTSTGSSTKPAGDAQPVIADVHTIGEPIQLVWSHRYEPEGVEAVRSAMIALGLVSLAFLLALGIILATFAFVMWVL